MRARMIAIFMAMTFCIVAIARDNVDTPDFAFPRKVIKQSEAALRTALRKSDGQATVSALLKYSIAETSIDRDNVGKTVAFIDSVRSQVSDSVTVAIIDLLEAELYHRLYQSRSWEFNRRTLPLMPMPDDPLQWSGDQFRARIDALYGRALANARDLQQVPVADWKSVLQLGKLTHIYYPTLYDFAVSRAIDTYRSIYSIGNVVPLRALSRPAGQVRLSDQAAWRVLSLYDDLIAFHHSGSPAPRLMAMTGRLRFLSTHLFGNDGENNLICRSLRDIYESNLSTEFCAEPLLAYADFSHGNDPWLYDAAKAFIKAHSAYPRIGCVRDIVARLEQKSIDVSMPESFAPGVPVTIRVKARNVTGGRLDIYRIRRQPDNGLVRFNPSTGASAKIGDIAVSVGDTILCEGVMEIPYTFKDEGVYIIVPTVDGQLSSVTSGYDPVWCTRLAMAASSFDGKRVWALDGIDGSPVADAGIFAYDSRSERYSKAGLTDRSGLLRFPDDKNCQRVYAVKDNSTSVPMWVSFYSGISEGKSEPHRSASVLTSLPLYHPGDTVRFVAVAYSVLGQSRALLENERLKASLTAANGETVGDIELVTDSFGRAEGVFVLPQSGLTGDYGLKLTGSGGIRAYRSFTVSDYKLPVFAISPAPAVTSGGSVTLSGTAVTYSGFPLAGAQVSVSLRAVPRFRWWLDSGQGTPFYTLSAVTDASGRYSVTVPADVLDGSPSPDGPWSAAVTVTSPSGESQHTSDIFTRRESYSLFANIPSAIDVDRPVVLNIKVTDISGDPATVNVTCRILRGDSLLSTLTIPSASPRVDLSSIPSGPVEMRFNVADGDSATVSTVLYRPTDTACPVTDCVLWSPQSALTPDGSSGSVLVGAPADTHLLYTLSSDGKILEQRWVAFPAGMRHVGYSLPDSVSKATLSLNAVAQFRSSSLEFGITAPSARHSLVIRAESMRDRLQPGAHETWTFTVADSCGSDPGRSAVILSMYNASIDALVSSSRSLSFNSGYQPHWSWRSDAGGSVSGYTASRVKNYGCISIGEPMLQTYGRSFSGAVMSRGRLYNSAVSMDAVVNEMKEEIAVTEDEAVATASFDMAVKKSAGSAADSGQESAVDESGHDQTPFAYRDKEVPLAFFKPMLTTGDDGRLAFSFTVPDANTTWRFDALAFTRSLLSASMQRSIVASKPVMVQPDLPRFLRQGDRAEVRALVMNNSDADQSVATAIEIFDPATGQILQSAGQTDRIASGASAVAVITFDAPSTVTMVGYRVKSSIDAFADGEQALIPLLESAQPVISASSFYIPVGQTLFTTSLPKWSDGARVSLEFCENPAWYVVTALPSLSSAPLNNSVDAAGVIFSAAVADGILRSNPSVAKALRQWTSTDRSDSTLVSMLQRNADLKIALLQATPWMMDARSDSERMDRLALLFDRKSTSRAISRAVDLLARLQVSGGGWGWNGGDTKASSWATARVLAILGDLNRLGWLPDDKRLSGMIGNALRWFDADVADDYRRWPSGNYTEYVYIRDLFPDIRQSSAAERVSSATVQQLIGRWRDLDAPAKAVAAIILDNHNYTATSRHILESLREYAESSPEKGMWWPGIAQGLWSMNPAAATSLILDAFARIEPQSPDVDLIRQWIVMQKGAQDWGNSVSASRTVASFVAASGKWLAPAHGTQLAIAGNQIDVTPIDRTLGYIRTDISAPSNSGASLTVAGSAATPSWGTVFCQQISDMAAIEPHSLPDLSIDKQCFVVNADGTVRPLNGRAQVGQRVRVSLTIKCGRTMDYVTIADNRPACFEPVEQMPGRVWCDGLPFYRENSDAVTSLFINRLTVGTYVLTYDMWVNSAGVYTMGAATIQSQYNPSLVANTSGASIAVN